MNNTITQHMTLQETEAWLDWMLYYKGIGVLAANHMVLAERKWADLYEEAEYCLAEWQAWRNGPW